MNEYNMAKHIVTFNDFSITVNTSHRVLNVVVVVGPTPPPKNGGKVQQPFLRTPADGIPPSNRNPSPLVDWWPPSIQPAGAPPPREPSTNP